MTREQRRLAAIVSVDVVGYSRLMGRDEPGTLTRLKALRQEVLDPKIAEYCGRVVNTAGDNQLLEFPSVVDAVRCAVDVQRLMVERNSSASSEQRIDFRIGINVGDIIVSGDQIFGDGVNVAARVQALAPPGGICTSKVVRDQVVDKLGFTFEDLGAQEVKNIARPVEMYRVEFSGMPPEASSGLSLLRRLTRYFRMQPLGHQSRLKGVTGAAPAPPLRMAVAILPFTTPGGRSGEESLADQVTRSLTSSLASQLRMTQVLSHDLVAPYRNQIIDPRGVGRELDASYLVEGEVRRVDKQISVNAQLIDAASAAQLWSDNFKLVGVRSQNDIAGLLSQLSNRIHHGLNSAGLRRFAGPPAPNAGPMELTWHGYAVMYRDNNTVSGALGAREWFERALQLDPNFLPAIRGNFHTLMYELEFDPNPDHERILREADELSFRGVSIDNCDPISWFNRTRALIWQKRLGAALEAVANAEKHLPGIVGWHLNLRAEVMALSGKPNEALALVEQQLAQDPQDQEERGRAMLQRCRACMALGRYDEAIAACEKGVALDDWWLLHLYLAAGYALKDERDKAAGEKAAVLKLRPGTTIADFKKLYWSDNPDFVRQTETHLLAGLRKAGFSEE